MSIEIMIDGENARAFKALKINGQGGWQDLARRLKAGLYIEVERYDQWTLSVSGLDFLKIADYMRHPSAAGGKQRPGGGHQKYLMQLLGIQSHELGAKP